MKLYYFLMLIVVSLLVACEPVTLTETVEVEPRALPSPINQATISPTTESGTDDEGSPVASPLPESTVTDDETDLGGRRAVFPNKNIV